MRELTIAEAAKLAGVNERRINKLIQDGLLAAKSVRGRNGRVVMWLIREDALQRWVDDPAMHRAGRKAARNGKRDTVSEG